MSTLTNSFLIGTVAGLRSMTAPAAVSWAAHSGPLRQYALDALAAGELIADKLPKTPSRKAPLPFAGRVISGALCGAALGARSRKLAVGAVAGALGAVAGTLGGYAFRSRLVKATGGDDLPIALLEDAIAIGGAALAVSRH